MAAWCDGFGENDQPSLYVKVIWIVRMSEHFLTNSAMGCSTCFWGVMIKIWIFAKSTYLLCQNPDDFRFYKIQPITLII